MPRAELRLRLLSKVGEAKRVPTDQSWTSNRVGLATLRTAQRHAALHLQAYVRRLLQKRFTRGSGATSSSCQHILDHVQHLVQKGQAVIADIETTTAQRAAGHLFTWQARRQAYGEGVIALSNRPHKTPAQQQVCHRMMAQVRVLQATFRRNLARNRRRPPPPDKKCSVRMGSCNSIISYSSACATAERDGGVERPGSGGAPGLNVHFRSTSPT